MGSVVTIRGAVEKPREPLERLVAFAKDVTRLVTTAHGATHAFGQRALSHASRPFTGPILKGMSGRGIGHRMVCEPQHSGQASAGALWLMVGRRAALAAPTSAWAHGRSPIAARPPGGAPRHGPAWRKPPDGRTGSWTPTDRGQASPGSTRHILSSIAAFYT
jgi:hypothetical protein